MAVTHVIQILQFRPLHVGVDTRLREQLVPALRDRAGLFDIVAGRHGPDELGPRIVAAVWSPEARIGKNAQGHGGLPDETVPLLDADEVRQVTLSVRVQLRHDGPDTPSVLRVFRGHVRAGDLDHYVEEAEAGTRADSAAGRGPLALYLAVDGSLPDRFVTVSIWSDWSTIEAATGGDIHQPIATRHPELLVASDVTHYEVIEL